MANAKRMRRCARISVRESTRDGTDACSVGTLLVTAAAAAALLLRICHVRSVAPARDVAATHAARPESGYTAAVAHGPRRYVALPASRLTDAKPATRGIGPTGPSLLAATRGLHDRGHARHGDAHYRGPRDDSLHEPFAGHAALHLAAT